MASPPPFDCFDCDADHYKTLHTNQPTNQITSSNRKVSEGASTTTTTRNNNNNSNRITATLAQYRWLLRRRQQVHRHLLVAVVHPVQLLILHRLLPLRQRPGRRVHSDGWNWGRRSSWRPPSVPQSPPKRRRNANSRSNVKTRSSHDSPLAKLQNRYRIVHLKYSPSWLTHSLPHFIT